MSWDPVWEQIFRERISWGKYPPEELVRFIAKSYYSVSKRETIKILEVGCGPGSGPSWFIMREGFSFSGIDGSPTAIEKAKDRFRNEGLKGEFVVGEFNNLPWEDSTFDCVVDVASLQCNSEKNIKLIVKEIYRVLKPGGKHFSITAKEGCWGDKKGIQVDKTTYNQISEGPYKDMGIIRFASEGSIKIIYSRFKNISLEYSIRSVNNCLKEISNWIIDCEK